MPGLIQRWEVLLRMSPSLSPDPEILSSSPVGINKPIFDRQEYALFSASQ